MNYLPRGGFRLALVLAAAFAAFLLNGAGAEMNIQFPVAELGGCSTKEECHSYCERPANMNACLDFAERNGLMSERELSEARAFLRAGGTGPGGCTSKDSCESYCNDASNIRECIAFAQQNGMMSAEELDEAQKVIRALEAGATFPGGCKSKEECDAYCSSGNPQNMKECIAFAKAAGLMSEEELREVDKVLSALEKGVKPPACRGDEECAVYCADHAEECAAFGVASGMITEEQAAMLRKTGGRGPGGCLGKACETFCDDPANAEACFNFAVETGQIPPQDYQKMVEGRDRFKNEFGMMPSEVQECLRNSIGAEFDKLLSGNPPSPEARSKMDACFQLMRPPEGSDFGDRREGFESGPPPGYAPEGGQFNPPPGYEGQMPSGEFAPPYDPRGAPPPDNRDMIPPEAYQMPPPPDSTVPPPDSFVPPPSDQPASYAPAEDLASLLLVFFGVFQ